MSWSRWLVNVVRMMEQFRAEDGRHRVILFKNERGRFYWPAQEFNNIPYWNLTEGYQVKMASPAAGEWNGAVIPSDAPIPIPRGWNIIAYFPAYELSASAPDFYVISPILDAVIIAKNRAGAFIWPSRNFSNMAPWRESQGYQLKSAADVTLVYPPEEGQADGVAAPRVPPVTHSAGHWSEPEATGLNMSVLISDFRNIDVAAGDEVAAIGSGDRIVGTGVVQADGMCGIAVWGDDPTTEVVDGLIEAEAFKLKLWSSRLSAEIALNADLYEGSLLYESDGFAGLIGVAAVGIPERFYLGESYPNPFNSSTRITFGLPNSAEIEVGVYDLAGKKLAVLARGWKQAGSYSLTWNAEGCSAGIYFLKMEAGDFIQVRKTALVK